MCLKNSFIFTLLLCVLASKSLGAEPQAPIPSAPAAAPSQTTPASATAPANDPNKSTGISAKSLLGLDKKGKKTAEPKKEKSVLKIPADLKNLIVEDLNAGSGKAAVKGKSVKVNYTGWFFDPKQPQMKGFQLDTSEGKEPFEFTLGEKQVIAGWDEGLVNMKVGGKRKLYIPADLAYGSRGTRDGVVPVNQALLFEIELLDVMDEKTVLKQ